ncbi:HAD-IB family hydrolase [Propionicicella superfundia]|uniref:HAD-IB family hydrolase n=1 Tax=Propionicicella superfundia TaxID=348582 RepID=UPI000401F820|nr:HAD-IB family hydrolase [Propionicicella superfundia]
MPEPLADAHVLLTGATGFVGQAVLEKLLSSYPTTRVTVLVRPRGELTAQRRVAELLHKSVFRTWVERIGEAEARAEVERRVRVLEGDLGEVPPLPGDLTHVIHSASTVSFDLPIDEAFRSNVLGPVSLYAALRQSGADPHVVHVSTCYVAGLRKGLAEERSLDHTVDVDTEFASAREAGLGAEADSRQAGVLRPLLAKAEQEHRRAGALAVAEAAEARRREWVHDVLVDAGRTRAQSLGWPDVYTFTKAMGERIAEREWGAAHRLSVVRPTIIESALRHPFPGWIDGYKVADPLIAAYGRGLLPEFPSIADTILDIIPVDHVVNAILAAAAAAPAAGAPQYFQVASGKRNPLRFGPAVRIIREYFRAHPLTDAAGLSIAVPSWTFPGGSPVERSLRRRELAVAAAGKVVMRLPATATTRSWISTVYKAQRDLVRLRKFTDLYAPYTLTEVVFDDTRTRALHDALPTERQALHGFDVTSFTWRQYLQDIHIPMVPGLMRPRRTASTPPRPAPLPRRPDVLAVFDLHKTVAAANLLEHYMWIEMALHGTGRALRGFGDLALHSGAYLQAERRDRGDFIRTFMRRYAGLPESEIRAAMNTVVAPQLRSRLIREAVAQIEAHRSAGHRTVLITGQIKVFVEPIADLFDVVVAGEMECDEAGAWTGHLATSPLVGEARATWVRRYAEDEGFDLTHSYAYGDSYADRPWLAEFGNPAAVNPDAQLYRFARERRWPVLAWTDTPRARFSPRSAVRRLRT